MDYTEPDHRNNMHRDSSCRVRFYFAAGLALLVLVPVAGSSAQTAALQKKAANPYIRCAIRSESHDWNPAAAAVVTGTIENVSDGPLDVAVQPMLYLSPSPPIAQRDKYWSPVDLLNDTPLPVDKRSIGSKSEAEAITPRAIQLKFKSKGDSVRFRIDARHILWAREISSVWPSMKFFAVVQPGAYELRLVLETASGDCESNQLKIHVSSKQPH